ncbi:hypothetical protein NC653_028823 [Populus alba x Populus x berolinensis]|uniref:Uncharacterized protein n=1 Tax=Populus alba x Populus x berolinensis TaxID=444605 RepID=A0AAD6M0Y9_9ROSI|nr:hypothetical protein NC653_028823 [Populus alba x Populus x berolinensis]
MDFGLSEFQNIISSHHFLRQSTYRNQVHVALVEGWGKKGFRISDRVKEGTLSGALPSTTILQQTEEQPMEPTQLLAPTQEQHIPELLPFQIDSVHVAHRLLTCIPHPEAVTPRFIKFQSDICSPN